MQYVNGISELFPGSGEYPEMYAAQTFYNDRLGRRIEVSVSVREFSQRAGQGMV